MSASYLRPLALVGSFSAAITAVAVLGLTDEQDFVQMSLATLVVTVSSVALVALRWGADFTKAPLFWLVLYCFFHFGLVWTLGLVGEERVAQVSPTALYWIHTPYLRPAVTLAAIGAVVYAVVVSLLAPGQQRAKRARAYGTQQMGAFSSLSRAGLALQVAGVATLGVAVERNGGLRLLEGGYLTFLESAQDSLTGYAIWAVGVGSCLTQIGGSTIRRVGLGVFVAFAVVFFPLGLRGSVLFPACVLLATRSLIGRRVRGLPLMGAGVLAMMGSAIVRTSRVGAQALDQGVVDSVVSTITELGFSIRPTIEVLRWSSAGQEPTWFVSFFAVPIRLVEGLTGWHGGAPINDDRLFNVKINQIVGAIGGSPVAEGYDAAGTFGAVVVLAVVGIVLARAARGPFDSVRRLALFPVVVLPLTVAVRNSFAPVIPQVLLGVALVTIICLRPEPRDVRNGGVGHAPQRQTSSPSVAPRLSVTRPSTSLDHSRGG